MENKIQEIREGKKISRQQLAELMKTSSVQIFRLETGERKLTTEWLERFSKALQVQPGELIGSHGNIQYINKIGFVEAGNWQEALQLPETEWETVCYETNDALRSKKVFALGVRGNSMNRIFPPERTTLICLDISDYYDINADGIQNGDYIIVQRISQDGKYEATVKRYTRIDSNTVILSPESTDDSFKPIVLTANDNNGYEIKAVVIDYQMKLKKL